MLSLLPLSQDLELSFSPEIGDATVGSLAVCTSKDSSIDGPGYLSALVSEVTYVDEVGKHAACIAAHWQLCWPSPQAAAVLSLPPALCKQRCSLSLSLSAALMLHRCSELGVCGRQMLLRAAVRGLMMPTQLWPTHAVTCPMPPAGWQPCDAEQGQGPISTAGLHLQLR
jgi:hypothetical protein